MTERYPYRHHGSSVHGSKLEDFLISELNMIEDGVHPHEQSPLTIMSHGLDLAKDESQTVKAIYRSTYKPWWVKGEIERRKAGGGPNAREPWYYMFVH